MATVHLDVDVFDWACADKGWESVTETAQGLKISRATYYRWHRGEPVSLPEADRVRALLNVRFEALFVSAGGDRRG